MRELATRSPIVEVSVRPATPRDVFSISSIASSRRIDAMPPYFPGGVELNRQWIADNRLHGADRVREEFIFGMQEDPNRTIALVATVPNRRKSGRVVGYVYGKVDEEFSKGIVETCVLEDIAVNRDFERRGIGSLLERDFYKWARDAVSAQINVQIPVGNWRALEFFTNRGYESWYGRFHQWPENQEWSVAAPYFPYYLHPREARGRNFLRYPRPAPRPEWHEPTEKWGESMKKPLIISRDGLQVSGEFQGDFMMSRARLLMQGENMSHVRKLESVCYDLLATHSESSAAGFEQITENQKFVGLRDASLPEDEFIHELMIQRAASFGRVTSIAQRLARVGVVGAASGRLNLPAVLLNIDNENLPVNLGVSSQDVTNALQKAPQWKASEHMFLFSNKDKKHDYKRYAIQASADLGIPLSEFLLKQQTHEGLHPIIDYFTDHWFGEYATWLNEGFCDLLAGFETRATSMLAKEDNIESLTLENVMEAEKRNILQGGGYYLLKSIGLAINPEDVFDGVSYFLSKVFTSNVGTLSDGIKMNKIIMSKLDDMGILPLVERYFQGQMHIIANGLEPNGQEEMTNDPLYRYWEMRREMRMVTSGPYDDYALHPTFAKIWDELRSIYPSPHEREKMLDWLAEFMGTYPKMHFPAIYVTNLLRDYRDIEAGEVRFVKFEEHLGPNGREQRPVYQDWLRKETRADYDPVPPSHWLPFEPYLVFRV